MSAPDWGVDVHDCSAYDSLETEKKDLVVQMATDFLWEWTGRAYGINTVTLRPCRSDFSGGVASFWGTTSTLMPALVGGQWVSVGCGSCGNVCGCTEVSSLFLPGPVLTITEILIDGVVMDPSRYRVDDHRLLLRIDEGRWPVCQDMALPTTAVGTWQITYTQGVAVPAGGQLAANMLACEFAKSFAAPKECSLPQRIQQITRQGVSVTVMDDFTTLKEGGTGIWVIDSWVASVTKPVRQSSVRSPDIPHPRHRRTTWTGP